jgi:mRNA interferase HigB
MSWVEAVERATWKSPDEVKSAFSAVSVLTGTRFVFNIKGNEYRIIAEVDYGRERVMVRFAGTHAEYGKIDAREI